MKKLNAKGMKVLKVFHLLFVMIWLVGIISMWVLSLLTPASGGELSMQMASILWIDHTLTIPGAMLTVVTGVIYGLFTNWGFFKHGWLTCKWIVSVLVILVGTFFFHPSSLHAMDIIRQGSEAAMQDAEVIASMSLTRCSSFIQAGILVCLVVVSVFKPKKKRSAGRSPKDKAELVTGRV